MIKIATWNINSVRLRLPLVKKLADEQQPDIICLQETKVIDELFPLQGCIDIGYPHTIFSGEKSYNGVAILSKIPLKNMQIKSLYNEQKRHISATLPNGTDLHNFYIPAGGDIPDPDENPKFAHKLSYVDEMSALFSQNNSSSDKIIIVGDFNIAPLENDVWSHKQLLKIVSHTPVEVEKLGNLRKSLDWIDTSRLFVPDDEKLYSWWSYRNRDWKKSNRGRRLDHIWATPALKNCIHSSTIVTEIRDWEKPSDHVPVITEFSL